MKDLNIYSIRYGSPQTNEFGGRVEQGIVADLLLQGEKVVHSGLVGNRSSDLFSKPQPDTYLALTNLRFLIITKPSGRVEACSYPLDTVCDVIYSIGVEEESLRKEAYTGLELYYQVNATERVKLRLEFTDTKKIAQEYYHMIMNRLYNVGTNTALNENSGDSFSTTAMFTE